MLVLLAIPPLLSGTYAGIDSVDPAARDAARGHGHDRAGRCCEGRGCPARCRSSSRAALRDAAGHRHRDHRRVRQPRRPGPLPHRRARPRATTSRWSAGRSSSPSWRSSPTASWPCSRDGPSHRESPDGPRVLPVHAPDTPIPTRTTDSAGADRPDGDPRQAASSAPAAPAPDPWRRPPPRAPHPKGTEHDTHALPRRGPAARRRRAAGRLRWRQQPARPGHEPRGGLDRWLDRRRRLRQGRLGRLPRGRAARRDLRPGARGQGHQGDAPVQHRQP